VKRSLNSQYHLLILVLLGLVLLESLLLLVIIERGKNSPDLTNDLQTTIITFIFVVFVYTIASYNFIPVRVKKSLNDVSRIIEEISHGNYNMDIDLKRFEEDPDIRKVIQSIQGMLRSVHGFDKAKEEKIFEHDQRIKQLINLVNNSILILRTNGEISYCNDAMRRKYSIINDSKNIDDLNFKSEFEQRIFVKIKEALRQGNNLYDIHIPDIEYKQQVLINGSIVRNTKGDSIGGVYILLFAENA
jgi:hypothetical protein